MTYKDKKIAVAGVSDREEKYGFKIFRDLLAAGYNVSGINPRGGEVLEKPIYKDVKEVPDKPDIVITVVMPQITEKIVQQCRELGVKEVWMQPGSQSELAVKTAKEAGIKVTHDACFMVHEGVW